MLYRRYYVGVCAYVSEVGEHCQLDLNLQNLYHLAVSEVGERCQLDLNLQNLYHLAVSEVDERCQLGLNII